MGQVLLNLVPRVHRLLGQQLVAVTEEPVDSGYEIQFYWVCAAGNSEPYPIIVYFWSILWANIGPIFVSFGYYLCFKYIYGQL